LNEGISVVVPVCNSQNWLPELHQELHRVLDGAHRWEVVFVEDGSTDRSWDTLSALTRGCMSCRGIQLARNCGQTVATNEGILVSSHEFIVTMDDDLQHPVSAIPELAKYLCSNREVDAVFAKPLGPWHSTGRLLGSKTLNALRKLAFRGNTPFFSSFRILRRSLALHIASARRVSTPISFAALEATSRISNIAIEFSKNPGRKSRYNPRQLVAALIRNLLLTFENPALKNSVPWSKVLLNALGVAILAFAWSLTLIAEPGVPIISAVSITVLLLQLATLNILRSGQSYLSKSDTLRPLIRDSFG